MFEAVIWGIYACGFIGLICIAGAISDRVEAKKRERVLRNKRL